MLFPYDDDPTSINFHYIMFSLHGKVDFMLRRSRGEGDMTEINSEAFF